MQTFRRLIKSASIDHPSETRTVSRVFKISQRSWDASIIWLMSWQAAWFSSLAVSGKTHSMTGNKITLASSSRQMEHYSQPLPEAYCSASLWSKEHFPGKYGSQQQIINLLKNPFIVSHLICLQSWKMMIKRVQRMFDPSRALQSQSAAGQREEYQRGLWNKIEFLLYIDPRGAWPH